MKDLKYVLLIIGTLFGAGFATGKELAVFFVRFGSISYIVPIIVCILLYFSIYFLIIYFKQKKCDKITENIIVKCILFIIYLIFSASMFSALILFLHNNFLLNNYLIYFLSILFCYFILRKKLKFITEFSKFLTPILVVLFLFICFKYSFNHGEQLTTQNSIIVLPNSILYLGANIILLTNLLENSAEKIVKPKRVAMFSSLLFSLIVSVAIFALNKNTNHIYEEMPLLEIIGKNSLMSFVFGYVFVSAILTSLTSFLFATKNTMPFKIKNSNTQNLICVLLIVITSLLGFSKIVENLYFVIGILGLLLFAILCLSSKFCFYFTNNKIHKPSKNTKNNDARHY